MTVTLKRQLSNGDKARILELHGRVCFATGHPIANDENIQFDHIQAFTEDGASEVDNIAPMCEMHNKAKGVLPLGDFRVKLRLEEFFKRGDTLTLHDLLLYLKESGDIPAFSQPVAVYEKDRRVYLETAKSKHDYPLHSSATAVGDYFYATLPVEVLDSDDTDDRKIGLQPRYLIFDKVFDMYRHFQRHPVLQPSIGRVDGQHVVLFDGQHKVAALLLTGRREFECKIYLNPDLRLLNQTNIAAHDRFAQTRFFSSIMVLKLGTEFGADFEAYKNLEDGAPKSEAGFMKYLERDPAQTLTRAERNERFRSYLYNSILDDPENKCAVLVSKGNRSTDEKPLTIDMLEKSILATLLYREPVEDNMATDSYKRDKEIAGIVAVMNMIYDLALASWNPKAGPNDENQRKLRRLFGSKSIMAWSELLRDAICGKLDLQDAEDRARPFYRDLSPQELDRVRRVVERLVTWKGWRAPANGEIDNILAGSKGVVKDWLRHNGLTTGYLMGASE